MVPVIMNCRLWYYYLYRRIPRAAVMASLASRRETSLRMRRVVGLVEIRHVATDAGGWRAHKLASSVAGIAVQSRVRSH